MDSQGLRQEFVYNGTPQEFANYLWALEQNQWGKFTDEKLAWQQLAPQPIIRSHAGRPPYQVDYMGTSKVPFIDPADGQEREATEPVPGITLELEPLANGQTRVVAQCHNRAFEGWYFRLLELCGAPPKAQQSGKHNAESEEPRGMKVGTAERVHEMHRLLKAGYSQRQAKQQAHCDPSTYHRWCLEVTDEEPILPYS